MKDEMAEMSERNDLATDSPWVYTGRSFKLWDYSPTHGQLLLRSATSRSHEKNLDLKFWGVEWIHLDRLIPDLAIRESNPESFPHLLADREFSSSVKIFEMLGESSRSLIAAAGYEQEENDLDPFRSSLSFSESPVRRALRSEAKIASLIAAALPEWRIDLDVDPTLRSMGGRAVPAREADILAISPDETSALVIEVKSYSRVVRRPQWQPALNKVLTLARSTHEAGFLKVSAILLIDMPVNDTQLHEIEIFEGSFLRGSIVQWSVAHDPKILITEIRRRTQWMI